MSNYPLLTRLVAAAVSASNKSGQILRDIKKSGQLNVQEKAANDFVTKADFMSQLNIIRSLESMFPKLRFCGEEGELTGEYTDLVKVMDEETLNLASQLPTRFDSLREEDIFVWVDPLDGTREYTQGYDVSKEVTVLIGISVNGEAIAGIMNQPFYDLDNESSDPNITGKECSGRCLWGIVGLGAFDTINGKIDVSKQSADKDNKTKIVTTRSYITPLIRRDLEKIPNFEILQSGGAGSKVLCVIEGKAECYIYPRNGTKRWDTCAPEAILRSLGGSLTDIYGNPYSYLKRDDLTVENCYGIVASIIRQPSYYCSFLSDELKEKVMEDSTKPIN